MPKYLYSTAKIGYLSESTKRLREKMMKMKLDFKEQIKRWFPTLTKQQLQLKEEQLKKEAAQMAQTPDVSLHQYRTKKWATLSRKAAECIEAAMAEGIPRTSPMWPDANLMGVRFKRVTKKMQTTNT